MATLEVHESILETVSDNTPMAVLRKRPAGPKLAPPVVLFHDGPGIRDATHTFARRLAGHNYDVIVPDLYHRLGRMIGYGPAEVTADPDAYTKIFSMLATLTDSGIQRDLDTAMSAWASERAAESSSGASGLERVGCAGFCLGARAVFRTMMRLPEQFVAGAMWHPSFLVDDQPDSPHLAASELPGRLYAGFGEDDTLMSVDLMRPFIDAVSTLTDRVTVDILPGAGHGYTWPDDPVHYHHDSAERAWTATLDLFASALSPAAAHR